MDVFRQQAWDEFLQEQEFSEPSQSPMDLSVVTIRQFESETKFDQTKISEKDIAKRMREPVEQHENKKAIASLQLVRIDRDLITGNVLAIEQKNFVNLFRAMNTDAYCLQLFVDEPYGVYQFKHLLDQGQGYILSIYASNPAYAMIWSYKSTDFTTKAIIIPGRLAGFEEEFVSFVSTFELHQALVDNPKFLLFICGIYFMVS